MTTSSADHGTTMPSEPYVSSPRPRSGADRSAEVIGATSALAHVVATLSPVAARRASVRFAMVDHCVGVAELDPTTRVDALTAALMAELGSALARRPTTGVIAAEQAGQILRSIAGFEAVAHALRHQHERWDGSGGPDRLSGNAIPVLARLVAVGSVVADVITDADGSIDWGRAANRVDDLRGTHLDPAFSVSCVGAIDQGEFGPIPSLDEQLDRLASLRPGGRSTHDVLSSISAAIGAIDDLADVVALIADEARRDVGAASVNVARYQPERGELRVLVNVGALEAGQVRFPVEEVHPFDITRIATLRATALDEPNGLPGGLIAAPIHSAGKLWGFMLARSGDARGPFDAADLRALDRVADELAQAVDKVERLGEVIDMALRDPLTGLANRRVLDQRLAAVFDRPVDHRPNVALIMCDLDKLKIINDTLGHSAGDEVLIEVASSLRAAVAAFPQTEVCRIGGDEFCIFIEEGGRREAEQVTDRIDELVARLDSPSVSVSCGIGAMSSTIRSASDLLRAADEAQYAVKRVRRGAAGISLGGGRREHRGR